MNNNVYMTVYCEENDTHYVVPLRYIPIFDKSKNNLDRISIANCKKYGDCFTIVNALNDSNMLNEHLESLNNLLTLLKGCVAIKTNSASVTLMLQTEILKTIIDKLTEGIWFRLDRLRLK